MHLRRLIFTRAAGYALSFVRFIICGDALTNSQEIYRGGRIFFLAVIMWVFLVSQKGNEAFGFTGHGSALSFQRVAQKQIRG